MESSNRWVKQSYFGLRKFAPPFGPSDLARRASGVDDNLLIGGTERLGKAGQRGLDDPWFEHDACGLAVTIEFLGHSQRLQCGCHASQGDQDPLRSDCWRVPVSRFLDEVERYPCV